MNVQMAHALNKQHRCAGCGVCGEPLQRYFWNEYDFKYCEECLARRKLNIAPDWVFLRTTESLKGTV